MELEIDADFVASILRVRAYQRAKRLVDSAQGESDLPQSELIDQVIVNRLELKRQIFERKKLEAVARQQRQISR